MTRNKNIFYTFLFAAAASCIFTASTLLGISVFTEDEYVGIVIGVALMLVALLFHNLAKLFRAIPRSSTVPCFISYLLNTVGCGFVASSYYTAVKSQAELGELFAAALPAILLVLLCTCVFIFTKKHFTTVLVTFCVLDAALAAFAVYGWITDDSPFFSFLLFSCVFSIFYVIALYDIARNEENVLGLLLIYPEYRKKVIDEQLLTEEDFHTEFNKKVFLYITRAYVEGDERLAFMSEEFNPDQMGKIARMKIDRMAIGNNSESVLVESIDTLRRSVEKGESEAVTDVGSLTEMLKKLQSNNNDN